MSNRKISWLAVLCLITAPAAVEAQIHEPRFDQVTIARNAGDFGRAIQLIEEIDAQHPNDPTTLRLLGNAYAAGGDYILAVETLKRARLLAPEDQDIALALGRVMIWSGRLDEAQAIASQIALAQPDNIELPDLRRLMNRARQNPANRPRIALSHTLSWVKIGSSKADWTETVVSIDAPVASRTTVVGEIDVENRAGTEDTRFVGQIDRRLARGAAIYLAGSFTANPDFREDWSLRAGGEVQLFANTAFMGALRHADYGSSNVTVFEPGVRIQSANGRASITVKSINFWAEGNDYRNGWSARTDVDFWQTWLLSAGAATYPDTEASQTRRVRSFFGALTAPLTNKFNVRLGAEYEKRIGSYHRTGVTFGIAWRFGQ
jgi:YaiO family outer membrane protein